MRICLLVFLAACGASKSDSAGTSAAADAGAGLGCLSSNECPTGWTCNDFHMCEQPPPNLTDGGTTPPETEYQFGQPTSSQRNSRPSHGRTSKYCVGSRPCLIGIS